MRQPAALRKVALIVGSSRLGGNGAGLASWLSPIIHQRLNQPLHSATRASTQPPNYQLVVVDPTQPPQPWGPIVDGSRMPSQIRDKSYSSKPVQDWSTFISSCAAFVILTPEYNGGYPGELKNAIDQLFWEWQNKPVMVVSYGGSGGARCAAQLKPVLQTVKLRQVSSTVQIKLPAQFLGGPERVTPGSQLPLFLTQYVRPVEDTVAELLRLLDDPIAGQPETGPSQKRASPL